MTTTEAITILTLRKLLEDTRREYEDALDCGENVTGIRARRDAIIALLLDMGVELASI